jgi:hypothetical protein
VSDEVNGTPYGRPEDVIVGDLKGTEVLHFTTTSEDAAYCVFLHAPETAEVKVFASRSTVDVKTGNPVGTPFNNPDASGGLIERGPLAKCHPCSCCGGAMGLGSLYDHDRRDRS